MNSRPDRLASGVERAEIVALLREAEPQRWAALSSSLNLVLGIAATILAYAPLGGLFIRALIALVIAVALWRLCNRMWRDLAIAALAPAIGVRWGQTDFASGWHAVGVERWLADLFSEAGTRVTAWQSEGRYRDISYRLAERTTWSRRRNSEPREVLHAMHVKISVPQPFSGSVELTPKAGFMSKVDDVLRRLTGDAEQRIEVDPAFDALFDTIASGNASVDDLLTPQFRRAMLALAARHPRLYLKARFEHGWFSLHLPIPHLVFSSASLLKPMAGMAEDADTLWWDLTIPHRLIDGLMGDHDGPLR